MAEDVVAVGSVEEARDAVRAAGWVRARGGGTKSAMSAGANLSLAKLSGVLEYNPSEYTFTARAGTTLAEVRDLLNTNGQYLPFDPVLVEAGGTLGGAIASGLSGPGRFRYGGVRDFLLGIRFITGDGEVHSGGGKVVKNAAGFDFPKLMVGACGEFGVLVEATFKVFPRPRAYATLVCDGFDRVSAAAMMTRLALSALELACLDYVPPGRLVLRVGGLEESLPKRIERTAAFLGRMTTTLRGNEDVAEWQTAREFTWQPPSTTLMKVAIRPSQVEACERAIEGSSIPAARRYSVGGNVLWLAWPNDSGVEPLRALLGRLGREAIAIRGETWGFLSHRKGGAFANRLASVLDPRSKYRREDARAMR